MEMAKRGGAMAAFVTVAAFSSALLALANEELQEDTPSSSSSKGSNTYTHTWPTMKFGWRIVVGTLMAFCGAALGSGGGVGGAGIFVPMLTLIIGFDTKSCAAVSKCMVVGSSASSVYYNIRQRHPTLDTPIIDYDLALLFQPMLVLGISIGVTLNVLFAEWMVTLMLIILCIVTSTMAFFRGIKKWKKETIEKEADRRLRTTELASITSTNVSVLPGGSNKRAKVSIIENVQWKKLGVIVCVWITILALQISKSYTSNCSTMYWVINFLQIPVVVAASGYEAVMLYKGKRVILSRGEKGTNFKARQLVFYCFMGVVAGSVGGMVGLGGGAIMGPLFLGMGVPPQVSSATSMFAVVFSSSMSIVEYYLLKRFPIPYTLYFVGVTITGALVGQYVIKKAIENMGRASLIIFVLAFFFFISAFFIGGQGIVSTVHKIEHHNYMGFDSLCSNS